MRLVRECAAALVPWSLVAGMFGAFGWFLWDSFAFLR